MEPYDQPGKINKIKQQQPIEALRKHLKQNLNNPTNNIRKKQTERWRKKSVSPIKDNQNNINDIRKKQSSRWSNLFWKNNTPDKNPHISQDETPKRKKKVEWVIKKSESKYFIKS